MNETKIIMCVSDLQENLDEVIDECLTVYITHDDSEEIVAVLMPIEDYEDMEDEIDSLQKEVDNKQERLTK